MITKKVKQMELLRQYALSFVGVPYIFGGSHPARGIDCSEYIQIILKSVGLDPPGDQTAQGLYDHFATLGRSSPLSVPKLGSLVFFGESVTKITHVAFAVDRYRILEAAGGDKLTLTVMDAVLKKAFVKMSLLAKRDNIVAVLQPNYSTIGYI